MIRLIVNYGIPKDKKAFDTHYKETHIPLTQAIPNLKGFEISQGPVISSDSENEIYLTAILTYNCKTDMDSAMASIEGKAAVSDLSNFATGGVSLVTIDIKSLM